MSSKTEKIDLFYCDLRNCVLSDAELKRHLNEADLKRFNAFTSLARKHQFGMGRWAVKQGLRLIYDLPESHAYQLHDHQLWVAIEQSRTFSISISHSGEYVVVVIAVAGCALGVDVEQHKTRNYPELLEEFATLNESKLVLNSAVPNQTFYRLWTAKEALLKATQTSLSEIAEADMSACILSTSCQVAEHYYYYRLLGDDSYSLSLISDRAFSLEQQKLQISPKLS